MTIKIGNDTLTDSTAYVFIAICVLAGIVLLLSIGIAIMWIKYSLIERNNSKNWTGEDATKWIFNKTGMVNVEIKSSIFYMKYWNYNKRRGTYKLRPWTFNRRSIWTLMEAAQQAYASSIRATKGKTFWLLFRLPGIIRAIGVIGGIALMYLGLKDSTQDWSDWTLVAIGVIVIFISFLIAECGRLWVLWRNVPKLLKESGLTEAELKAINRIYFWRFVYSVAAVILEIVKLVLQIMSKYNNNQKRG